jgi:hypothetical protein
LCWYTAVLRHRLSTSGFGAGFDGGLSADHNQADVSPPFARTVAGLLLAPAIALAATATREHVHEADTDHPRSAVHRHGQGHIGASHDHDDNHAQLADDDENIVWLKIVALDQRPYTLLPPALPPVERSAYIPQLVDWLAPPDYDTAPPHGPPRACLSLRAPPASRLS